jgi:predicted DNA-binding transcriptional regulator YafY
LTELKILVDAVESSRFVSKERSEQLIKKLRRFAGKLGSGELNRSVYIEDRVKTDNDGSMENIDVIHRAINRGVQLEFKYFDYTRKKEKIYRHDGRLYRVSPISLVFSEENYYLVAEDLGDGVRKNFRVDKMDVLSDTAEKALLREGRFNPAEYSRKIFGMYGGREELVTLECKERLSGVIIDRFGKDVTMIPTDFGFRVSVRVMVSPTFFAWVMGFAKDMRIISPASVIAEIKEKIEELLAVY